MGQRSEGSDQAVADAVKAADAYMLGNSMIFGICGKQVTNILITTPLCRDGPPAGGTYDSAKARAFSKEKEDAANLNSPKTRAAPAVVNTSKAAKKSKTSAPTCQVRHD